MRKPYSDKVKMLAVKRVLMFDERITDVARDLEIGKSTLYNWVSEAKQEDKFMVNSLKKRLEEVSKERDILIKAATILVKKLL